MCLARGALVLVALPALFQGGCAVIHGTRPQDMSAPEHQRAALAARERAAYAAAEAEKGGRAAFQQRAKAEREAQLAMEHADAANVLLAAERSACDGVAPGDIAEGLSRLDVIRVSRLDRPVKFREVPEGVAFVVRTTGRSFESFAQVVRCRIAHAAITRDPADPLSVSGVYVRTYRDDGDAAVVQIVSRDEDVAEEVIRRVQRSGIGGGIAAGDGDVFEGGGPSGRPAPQPTDDPRTHGADPSRPGGSVGVDPVGGATRPGGRPGP